MLEYISDLRLFVEACRTLNFRKAGEKLGYSPAVVSARIKRLELITGKSLFIRSTRHISVTEEGRQLLAMAQQMLDLSELMTEHAKSDTNRQKQLQGSVRISAPYSFGRLFLSRPLRSIAEAQPELGIELLLEDSPTNLVKEGIDISFRVGNIEDSSMKIVPIAPDRRILLASPSYLAQFGTPTEPEDIRHHRCLTRTGATHWTFYADGKTLRLPVRPFLQCNTGDYLTEAAIAGLGLTVKSEWSAQDALESGKLVHVLPEFEFSKEGVIAALLPERGVLPMRVRYVLDTIANSVREQMEKTA